MNAISARSAARWCGPLLIATGVLHLSFGVIGGWSDVVDLFADGVGSATAGATQRESWFWFLVAGVPLLLVGQLVMRHRARTGEVPTFLVWYLVAFAALVYFYPASGFWLFWPQAALAFYATRANRRTPAVSGHAA